MNYLAHFTLADAHGHALAGALLGDFVKGKLTNQQTNRGGGYPSSWIASIHFHRQIDTFTDNHPLIIRARQRFQPPYRRYAGIIIDLMFDHFLVNHWHLHGNREFDQFEQLCYRQLKKDENRFPEPGLALSRHLRNHQLLSGYSDLAVVNRALAGVGRRLTRANPLDQCLPLLHSQLESLRGDFTEFYPLLQQACLAFEQLAVERKPL